MSMALPRRFATLLQIPIPRKILLASIGMAILFLALDSQMHQSLAEWARQLADSLAAFLLAAESFVLIMVVVFLLVLFAVGLRSFKAWQEHQRVYEQLRKEQEYARSIIDCSMTMIIGTDKDRNIKEFNRAAEATYGYSVAEVRGQPVTMLYSGDQESSRVGEQMRTQGFFTGEVISRKKSGELFSIFISATLLRDPQGGILGAVGNSRDLTGE
ncbi:MAG: PAS domain-containing protein, partial [Magnetococcus sp. YQC-5]